MMAEIRAKVESLVARDDVLLKLLILQVLLYWPLSFLISWAVELVAYQRY
jgi:hypothetical protein